MERLENAIRAYIRNNCDLKDVYYCLVHIASLILEGDGAGQQDFGDDDTVVILGTQVSGCREMTSNWLKQIDEFCEQAKVTLYFP